MEQGPLEQLCEAADDFYRRGDAFGATGNLSVRVEEAVWITPTGRPLKGLRPAALACVGLDGAVRGENRPSKEVPFHLAVYRARADVRAIVHLHAPHTVALSCLEGLDPEEPLPPLTPYYLMRVAPLAVVPYFRPGSPALADAIGAAARTHDCLLLRNHGLVCTGTRFPEAVDRAVELEETARLFFLLRGERTRTLTPDEVAELRSVFGARR
jgi:ribulose-5-phosphate 4-epimerase/fuculose-1-phosphate aldolase